MNPPPLDTAPHPSPGPGIHHPQEDEPVTCPHCGAHLPRITATTPWYARTRSARRIRPHRAGLCATPARPLPTLEPARLALATTEVYGRRPASIQSR